jgi:regulator of replication initiation timing
VEEMENSVEARAMQRVDAVTKKTISTNSRQRADILNLHKEVDQMQRNLERAMKENQALRVEVDVKRSQV